MFATTKALAFLRSAELARSVKNLFLRPEEFETLLACSVKLPPPFGYSLLSKRRSFTNILNNKEREFDRTHKQNIPPL